MKISGCIRKMLTSAVVQEIWEVKLFFYRDITIDHNHGGSYQERLKNNFNNKM